MSRTLLKATSKVSSMTLLSRLLGFLRDMVFAQLFGAVAGFDAFLLAFKLPNFMRALFAEGAFAQAFVPVLVRYEETETEARILSFLSRTMTALWCATGLLTLLAVLGAPWVVRVFAPGFHADAHRFQLAVYLLRITFPYLMLITTAAFFACIMNNLRRFMLPAFVPCLLNVALIWAATQWTHMQPRISALAWGVILGGALQATVQIPQLIRLKRLPRLGWFWHDAGVRRVIRLMIPALFGVSMVQVGLLISTVFASYLQVGSLSWLYYSERLVYLPVGVLGVAITTVILPSLSRAHAKEEHQAFKRCLHWGVQMVLASGLPAAMGVALLAVPLLATLFHYGAFSTHDVWMTRYSLLAYSFGLPAFMLVKVVAAAFYAQQDIKTPVKVASVCVLLNIGLNAMLMGPLHHAGLALATSLSAWCNASTLLYLACKRRFYEGRCAAHAWLGQCMVAMCLMAIVLWFATPAAHHWFQWHATHRAWMLGLMIVMGAMVYICILAVFGWRWKNLNQVAP